mmetsp:Transcript_16853/g.43597  ORF Transcript_16853/g.43597 Transcript_16853/m.43597 type:complete len:301 (-) Transcript_16853:22-924(-)
MYALGHHSKVYEAVRAEDVRVPREHAKVAAQTVMASLSFDAIAERTAPAQAGVEAIATVGSLCAALERRGMPPEDAAALVAAIVAETDADGDGQLSFTEWSDLVTDDHVDASDVVLEQQKLAKRSGAAKAALTRIGQRRWSAVNCASSLRPGELPPRRTGAVGACAPREAADDGADGRTSAMFVAQQLAPPAPAASEGLAMGRFDCGSAECNAASRNPFDECGRGQAASQQTLTLRKPFGDDAGAADAAEGHGSAARAGATDSNSAQARAEDGERQPTVTTAIPTATLSTPANTIIIHRV